MQVEITKNGVATPLVCFLSSPLLKWPVGGSIYKPPQKIEPLVPRRCFFHTDRTWLSVMTGLTCQNPVTCQWPFETDRLQCARITYWSDSLPSLVVTDLTCPVTSARLWNLSRHDRTLKPCVSGHPLCSVRSSTSCCRDDEQCEYRHVRSPLLCSVWLLLLTPAATGQLIGASGPLKGHVWSPLPSSFLRDLASGLVPIFVLGLCLVSWVFYCASRVLLEVLIIGSSRRLHPSHSLHPIELQNNYSQTR
jgi:hypothetical protein